MAERGRLQMVEVDDDAGLVWLKSSASNGGGDTCLEVADSGDRISVRCSLDPAKSVLKYPKASWVAFVEQIRRFC